MQPGMRPTSTDCISVIKSGAYVIAQISQMFIKSSGNDIDVFFLYYEALGVQIVGWFVRCEWDKLCLKKSVFAHQSSVCIFHILHEKIRGWLREWHVVCLKSCRLHVGQIGTDHRVPSRPFSAGVLHNSAVCNLRTDLLPRHSGGCPSFRRTSLTSI